MGLLKNILKTTTVTAVAAGIASYATNTDTLWNKTLIKPSWQPPEIAFPIAWSILYTSIAGASAIVLTKLDRQEQAARTGDGDGSSECSQCTENTLAEIAATRKKFKRALGVNLVLNASWSILYWNVRNQWLSAAEVSLLAASSIYLHRQARAVSPAAGAALVPYAAWTSFATILNTEIARLNS